MSSGGREYRSRKRERSHHPKHKLAGRAVSLTNSRLHGKHIPPRLLACSCCPPFPGPRAQGLLCVQKKNKPFNHEGKCIQALGIPFKGERNSGLESSGLATNVPSNEINRCHKCPRKTPPIRRPKTSPILPRQTAMRPSCRALWQEKVFIRGRLPSPRRALPSTLPAP